MFLFIEVFVPKGHFYRIRASFEVVLHFQTITSKDFYFKCERRPISGGIGLKHRSMGSNPSQ